MLDVRRIETLRQLGRRRSFAAAADALGYTQSAVSQQISALEREVGVTLIERGVRPVRLTDAGDTLIELAEPVFEGLASLDAGLEAFRTVSRGRLRLTSFPSASLPLAGPALAAFHRDHPASSSLSASPSPARRRACSEPATPTSRSSSTRPRPPRARPDSSAHPCSMIPSWSSCRARAGSRDDEPST